MVALAFPVLPEDALQVVRPEDRANVIVEVDLLDVVAGSFFSLLVVQSLAAAVRFLPDGEAVGEGGCRAG